MGSYHGVRNRANGCVLCGPLLSPAAAAVRASAASVKRRSLAFHGHAVALAFIRPVVPYGHVLRAPVVPHGDVVLAPLKTRLVPRTLRVLTEELQNRATLVFRQTLDPRGEGPIHEE